MKRQVKPEFTDRVGADPQTKMASFSFYSPETGNVSAHHALFVIAGEIGDEGNTRIGLTVGLPGCLCGRHCPNHGTALFATPSPEHARAIAAQLIEMADQAEASATAAAKVILDKAAGR